MPGERAGASAQRDTLDSRRGSFRSPQVGTPKQRPRALRMSNHSCLRLGHYGMPNLRQPHARSGAKLFPRPLPRKPRCDKARAFSWRRPHFALRELHLQRFMKWYPMHPARRNSTNVAQGPVREAAPAQAQAAPPVQQLIGAETRYARGTLSGCSREVMLVPGLSGCLQATPRVVASADNMASTSGTRNVTPASMSSKTSKVKPVSASSGSRPSSRKHGGDWLFGDEGGFAF